MNETSSIHVGRATAADGAELKTLMLSYIMDFYKRPEPEAAKLEQLMERLAEGQIGVQFIARNGHGEALGFATLYFTYSTLRAGKAAVMNDLFVDERGRGMGAGKLLFEACVRYVREEGFAFMSWETAPENERARAFYDKMGGHADGWITYSIE